MHKRRRNRGDTDGTQNIVCPGHMARRTAKDGFVYPWSRSAALTELLLMLDGWLEGHNEVYDGSIMAAACAWP